ncbi:TauD/TfdA family dioxygenase [Nostoc cycadae]|uniref:Taurine catabolism dioxygenase tauD/tfdA n=1 Tax=Nostoc cycadae WK-1 TaxID=1861711 RepID=A0A2H6LNB9_9NOSO|nr:TauD/TfdA family dioxygenase [Nostoc cycadae]GBE94704.1 taurine catabolism dioxygenase tauD/tfdA [Nostoc cycadae WK-1]
MNFSKQPISATIGQQIINSNYKNILDLNKAEIISLFKYYGVLLFRGFTTDTSIFREFTNLFSTDFLDYAGGAFNRRVINGDKTILSVNDYQFDIKLHGEMYYQKQIPLMLWFFCAHPASENGETTICDGRQFFAALSDELKSLFLQKKLKLTVLMDKAEWQKKYKTDDINTLKEICNQNYTYLHIYPDKSICIEYIFFAVSTSKCGKYQAFINSLLPTMQLNPQVLKFEDDSEIPAEVIAELNLIAEKLTTNITWQRGDILMIDNTRIMHGRRAFTDDKREIYIRLCSPAFD